jgi:hypothetical protein
LVPSRGTRPSRGARRHEPLSTARVTPELLAELERLVPLAVDIDEHA